jgi:trigger factor
VNITENRIDDLNTRITVHMAPEDYKPKVKEELRNYAKKAKMPGFRPGKVPLNLVKKMVGIGLVIDTVSKTLNENLQTYIDDNQLNILGEPLPTEKRGESYFDIDCNKELEFSFEVGLAPAFELNLDVPNPVTRYEIVADDEAIEKRIEELKDRFGDLVYPEEVGEGDTIFGKLIEVNEAGEVVEGGFEKAVPLNPNRLDVPELFESLMGKKVEDEIPFQLEQIGDDEAIQNGLTLSAEELENAKGKSLHFHVARISRIRLAELNEELFRKVLGDETEVKTEEEFRAKIKEDLSKEFTEQGKYHFRGEIKKALEQNHSLDFPTEFLKKWLIETQENITEENVADEFDKSLEGLKWSLIVEKIRKEYPEETGFEESELVDSVKEGLKATMGPNVDEQMLESYTQYILQNEEMSRQYFYRLMDDKIFGAIEEKIPTESKEITAKDFEKLNEEEKGGEV